MKKLLRYGLVSATVLLGGCAHLVQVPPVVDTSQYHRLAVLPFVAETSFSTVGTLLADDVVVDLFKRAPQIEVMERARVDALLQEQSLAQGPYLDPKTAVSLGKLLGVQALLTGSVSVDIGNVRPTPLSAQRITTGVAIVRLIDAATGKIIWTDRKESEVAQFLDTEPDNSITYVWTDQETVQRVLQDLAANIAQAFYAHEEWR